jgi:hypothetical protein
MKKNTSLVKKETILGVTMSSELAVKLKDKYQNKQLDKLTTSVEAREAHVKKIASLKREFDELTSGVSIDDNVKSLSPKLREALAERVMSRHEDRLLDLLEQINREQKAIDKIDKSFELLGELM